jgi:hypothetical protein
MLTWRDTKWRSKALAISSAANSLIAVSVPVFGYFTAWMLIPGAYAAFWVCNFYFYGAGCKGWYENADWVCGWFVNTVLCWAAIWALGALPWKIL